MKKYIKINSASFSTIFDNTEFENLEGQTTVVIGKFKYRLKKPLLINQDTFFENHLAREIGFPTDDYLSINLLSGLNNYIKKRIFKELVDDEWKGLRETHPVGEEFEPLFQYNCRILYEWFCTLVDLGVEVCWDGETIYEGSWNEYRIDMLRSVIRTEQRYFMLIIFAHIFKQGGRLFDIRTDYEDIWSYYELEEPGEK